MERKIRLNGSLQNVEFVTNITVDDICVLMTRQEINRRITQEDYGRLPSYRNMAKYLTKTFVPIRTSKAGPSVTMVNVDSTEIQTVSLNRGNVVFSDVTGAY